MGLNRVEIEGCLGRDAEMRYTPNGKTVTKFPVAVNRQTKGVDGEWKDDAPEWFNVVAWGKCAESVGSLRKGTVVHVIGHQKTESWEKEGTKRFLVTLVAESVLAPFVASGTADRGVVAQNDSVDELAF